MISESLQVTAIDGKTIPGRNWLPADPASSRGIIYISHGMAEHCNRYAGLAASLTDAGYGVYSHDHRGHGEHIAAGELEGHLADKRGWSLVVADLNSMLQIARSRHPGTPLILLGHSMGSFIAQTLLIRYNHPLDGFILSGSNYDNPLLFHSCRAIAWGEARRQGNHGKSKLVDFLSFGSFNNAFKPARTNFDWLSRNPDEVDRYLADPWCGFLCTNRFWQDMMGGLIEISKLSNLKKIQPNLPIYNMAGDRDPVGKMGKGVQKLEKMFRQAGQTNVTTRLYPGGRHEMFNETNRDEVIADMLAWLSDTVKK